MHSVDFAVYTSFVEDYLLPKEDLISEIQNDERVHPYFKMKRILSIKSLKNFSQRIKVLTYCLMPNHIHLQLYQKDPSAISEFIQSIHSRYACYFNKKYHRVGTLFQERFKYTHCSTSRITLEVARYVHQNPVRLCPDIAQYHWSSMKCYKNKLFPGWIDSKILEDLFAKSALRHEYKDLVSFMEDPAP